MLDNDKFQEYFDRYNSYSKTYNLGSKYLELGKKIIHTRYYRLLHYPAMSFSQRQESKENNKVFLVIPSIFNSPEILFLSRDKNFIDNLRECGEVFLIDWLEATNPKYSLDDYVRQVIKVINKLEKRNINSINLVGHCIGGNLAIAANVLVPNSINTLTLLTTPWDFSHFFYIRQAHCYFTLDYYIDNLPIIPKIHIQFLLLYILLF